MQAVCGIACTPLPEMALSGSLAFPASPLRAFLALSVPRLCYFFLLLCSRPIFLLQHHAACREAWLSDSTLESRECVAELIDSRVFSNGTVTTRRSCDPFLTRRLRGRTHATTATAEEAHRFDTATALLFSVSRTFLSLFARSTSPVLARHICCTPTSALFRHSKVFLQAATTQSHLQLLPRHIHL